jgi:hypothetical protein
MLQPVPPYAPGLLYRTEKLLAELVYDPKKLPPLAITAPSFAHQDIVHVVADVGVPNVLLRYALLDERKRREFLITYPLLTFPKSIDTVVITLAPDP